MALGGHNLTGNSTLTETPVELPPMRLNSAHAHNDDDLQAFKDVVGERASSVVFSWPDDPFETHKNNQVLQTLEGALRESHQDVATSKPFFVLDGSGRRMASLSLLGNAAVDVSSYSSEENDFESPPGTWLRHYCSLRSAAGH
ncbi:MAG: hypothetical protein SGILL_010006 [Bacillariaceae sp.]